MGDEPIARRLEVASQDLGLADPIIGEEPIGRLGRRPVLAGHRQALADTPHPSADVLPVSSASSHD